MTRYNFREDINPAIWQAVENELPIRRRHSVRALTGGAGIGVGHIHMLNCVHYDEEKGIVKIIDNGGPYAMKVQTWTMQQFDQRFDGWAITLFPPQK